MKILTNCFLALCLASLTACVSVPKEPTPDESVPPISTGPSPIPSPTTRPAPDHLPSPEIVNPPLPEPTPEPLPAPTAPPEDGTFLPSAYKQLGFWRGGNYVPALNSFMQTCARWARRQDDGWLNKNLPVYGQIKDWREACEALPRGAVSKQSAAIFFQTHFMPYAIGGEQRGLLTAYYSPRINVRRSADDIFSEPVLARPAETAVQNLPRKDINAFTSTVLAYGRPIDVFFLQIQGSGRIRFKDGTEYRAAFDGHNSHKYKSIGSVLIARGDLDKDKASKQDIEDWMAMAGPKRARALMNNNPRYIFFKTEYVAQNSTGPKGSFGVPLTPMGSLAVDPRRHPYGALVYLQGKFPQRAGDYIGEERGLLVSAQDSGGAIKGHMRGDVFFGVGEDVGALAGVMKHRATWTLLLPNALYFAAMPNS